MSSEMRIYYLHSCAKLSASWLKDSHINPAMLSSSRILATACHYIQLEEDDLLPGPYDIANPFVQWALSSAWNCAWLLAYHEESYNIAKAKFNYKSDMWRVHKRFHEYLRLFPQQVPFTPPPFTVGEKYICGNTEESYRNYYKQEEASHGSYRRISVPFWLNVRAVPVVESFSVENFSDYEADSA